MEKVERQKEGVLFRMDSVKCGSLHRTFLHCALRGVEIHIGVYLVGQNITEKNLPLARPTDPQNGITDIYLAISNLTLQKGFNV